MSNETAKVQKVAGELAHQVADGKSDSEWGAAFRCAVKTIEDHTERAARLAEHHGFEGFAIALRRFDHIGENAA